MFNLKKKKIKKLLKMLHFLDWYVGGDAVLEEEQ